MLQDSLKSELRQESSTLVDCLTIQPNDSVRYASPYFEDFVKLTASDTEISLVFIMSKYKLCQCHIKVIFKVSDWRRKGSWVAS